MRSESSDRPPPTPPCLEAVAFRGGRGHVLHLRGLSPQPRRRGRASLCVSCESGPSLTAGSEQREISNSRLYTSRSNGDSMFGQVVGTPPETRWHWTRRPLLSCDYLHHHIHTLVRSLLHDCYHTRHASTASFIVLHVSRSTTAL